VIEYALLFGLGFMTAILAGLLLAPAIHRRIVKFTEDRIMATVPVKPAELRAQKDMVRAEMAAAVARTGHDLKQERAKLAALTIENDGVVRQVGKLYSDNAELNMMIESLMVSAGELRSQLHEEELKVERIREALAVATRSEREKDERIESLSFRLQRLTADIDNLKIELATRDTEAESFRARINALRDERETLRGDLKKMNQRAKDAELKLAREENRAIRLEDKLNSAISGNADKEVTIERRQSEIGRLKERLKTASAEAREANRALKKAGIAKPELDRAALAEESLSEPLQDEMEPAAEPPVALLPAPEADKPRMPTLLMSSEEADALSDEVRNQASAAAERLLDLKGEGHDEAMRREIADIAAKMIAITGQREGVGSPIRTMISGRSPEKDNGRVSLAERASSLLYRD
jgi:chromosome segregation ATPase